MRKAQFSLEFLLLLAAFLAFAGVFASAGKAVFQKSVLLSQEVSTEEKLSGACLYIDFFSLDGLHAVSGGESFQGFSSQGRRLFFGNFSAECNSRFRFEGGKLKVEVSVLEAR
ncbi:MAG: hypothetical protein QXR53_00550 [Candidatus Norongarragalinales archaeon]